MRHMGLDVGKKRIGIAISDELGIIATPLLVLQRVSINRDVADIVALARARGAGRIVAGLPINMNGSAGPMAEYVEKFMARLREEAFGIEVALWDERLSTVAVERVLIEGGARREERREVVDMLSAAYILQGYLDAANRPSGGNGDHEA